VEEREERYRLAALGSDDGLWDWNLRRRELLVCPRWSAMLGLPAGRELRSPNEWLARVHPSDQDGLRRALDAHLSGWTPALRHEHRLRHEEGGYVWVLCRGRAVRGPGTAAVRIAGTLSDVTDRVDAQAALRHAALHDPLTGVANRALFLPLLTQAIESCRRRPEHGFAVLFVDVDRFKEVNDTFGHLAGDELLVALAGRLQACLRGADTLARMGGDEFMILLRDVGDVHVVDDITARIQRAIEPPFAVAGREVAVTISVGVAFGHDRLTGTDAAIRAADSAMYRAKAASRRADAAAGRLATAR
jgi:diguanylate cyclase (GGDEF)-like protein/PAS domain S-box-containing protein